jgi:hypothetical protein
VAERVHETCERVGCNRAVLDGWIRAVRRLGSGYPFLTAVLREGKALRSAHAPASC